MTDEFCYYIRFHGIREIIQNFDDADNNQSRDMMNTENGIDYINCYDCFTSKICNKRNIIYSPNMRNLCLN